jgi:hypothetical protein
VHLSEVSFDFEEPAMAMTRDEVISTLNDLIETSKDG